MTTKTIPWPDDCPCCGGAVTVLTDAIQEDGLDHVDAWAYDGDDARCAEAGCTWTGCIELSEPGELAGLSEGELCGCCE